MPHTCTAAGSAGCGLALAALLRGFKSKLTVSPRYRSLQRLTSLMRAVIVISLLVKHTMNCMADHKGDMPALQGGAA